MDFFVVICKRDIFEFGLCISSTLETHNFKFLCFDDKEVKLVVGSVQSFSYTYTCVSYQFSG